MKDTIVIRDYVPSPPHTCSNANGGTTCDTCFKPVVKTPVTSTR